MRISDWSSDVALPIYFLLRRTDERRDSRASLTRILGRPATLGDVARHIHTFAATILDRVFLLGGEIERFDVTVHDVAQVHAQLDRGQGVLLFGSHLGSFEVLRVIARQRPDYRIDRKSTRVKSSQYCAYRMQTSA